MIRRRQIPYKRASLPIRNNSVVTPQIRGLRHFPGARHHAGRLREGCLVRRIRLRHPTIKPLGPVHRGQGRTLRNR